MTTGARLPGLLRLLPDYARTAFQGFVGHRLRRGTRVVVQGVVLGPGGVLLALRKDLHGWELPGGSPDPGEREEIALAREVREETGIEIDVERLSGEYHRHGFLPHVARVYRCRAAGGALRRCPDENLEVAFFDPERLPAGLLPWYREPLRDALAGATTVAVRHEHQGWSAIWAGLRIDLAHRLRSRPPAGS